MAMVAVSGLKRCVEPEQNSDQLSTGFEERGLGGRLAIVPQE